MALLKGAFKPRTVFLISKENPKLMQTVYVAGFPFRHRISSSIKVRKGIVSSLSGIEDNFFNIQIDAALQPGNSGGPIFDDKGNLVGVAVAKLSLKPMLEKFGEIPENINFGIKSSVLTSFLDSNNTSYNEGFKQPKSLTELGRLVSEATYHMHCWMTMAQIRKFQEKKVLFREFKYLAMSTS